MAGGRGTRLAPLACKIPKLRERGFLLICAENHRREIIAALIKEGLVEHRFRFDFDGSKIVYNI